MSIHYVKNRRERVGPCNICRNEVSLSWDHIPPRGSLKLAAVEMGSLMQVFSGTTEARKGAISQNGLKFRTICQECNSKIGTLFDPTLNELSQSVTKVAQSKLYLPKIVAIKTSPQRLIRGVLSHLLAAKISTDEVQFDSDLRQCIFDLSRPIPSDVHIFYWLYPYQYTIIIRDALIPAVRGSFKTFALSHVLKSLPIGYLISNTSRYEGLPELTYYRNAHPDETVSIPIQTDQIRHEFWPEMPERGNVIFGGQSLVDSIVAAPRELREEITKGLTVSRARQRSA